MLGSMESTRCCKEHMRLIYPAYSPLRPQKMANQSAEEVADAVEPYHWYSGGGVTNQRIEHLAAWVDSIQHGAEHIHEDSRDGSVDRSISMPLRVSVRT